MEYFEDLRHNPKKCPRLNPDALLLAVWFIFRTFFFLCLVKDSIGVFKVLLAFINQPTLIQVRY